MGRLGALLFAAAAVCGAANAAEIFTPREAIEAAASAAPTAVKGVFVMTIKTTGRQDGFLYLNSEDDYRDQRNLTVGVPPELLKPLEAKYGAVPDSFFVGKKIAVGGEALRMKIWFLWQGAPTTKYYYQTHVTLTGADQIQLLTVAP